MDADNDRIRVQNNADFAGWSDVFQAYVKRRDSGFDAGVLRIYVDDPAENDLFGTRQTILPNSPPFSSSSSDAATNAMMFMPPPTATPPPSLASGTASSSSAAASASVSDSLLAVLLRNPEMLLEIPQLLARLLQANDPQYLALQDARRNNDAAKAASSATTNGSANGADSQDAMAKIIKLLESLGLDDQQQQQPQQSSSSSSNNAAVGTTSDSLTSSTGFLIVSFFLFYL